jgi:UDPglucose 6-dehydrogenase
VRAVGGRSTADLAGRRVGVLGLTFKAGTDDLRESPSLAVIAELRADGAEVQAYDPTVAAPLDAHRSAVLEGITICSDPVAVADGADVLVVLTEWPEFASIDLDTVAASMNGDAVVDARNLLDPSAVRAAGLRYDGVGRS